MLEKEKLTKMFLNVRMDEIKISNNDFPIIGTQGLGPCISFILHNKENKKTIVGHLSTDMFFNEEGMLNIVLKIYNLVKENNIKNTNFDLYLIEGAMQSIQEIYLYDYDIIYSNNINAHKPLEVLELLIKNIKVIKINKIIKDVKDNIMFVDFNGNIANKENSESSIQFAFDSRSGEFVTNKIFSLKESKRKL